MKYNYDPEGDILAVTVSDKPFDYATELGDIIVHFDKDDKPVYIEILHAGKFLSKATTVLPKSSQKAIFGHSHSL